MNYNIFLMAMIIIFASSDMGNVKCENMFKHVQNNVTIASNY